MLENLPGLLSATVGDVFSSYGWQLGNVTGAASAIALQKLLRRRLEKARDILFESVGRGERTLTAHEADEVVSIVYRYLRSAQEGAARLNLRLMADVIAGQARYGDLRADEFLPYADTLASLRREEIIYLGALHRHWTSAELQRLPKEDRRSQVWRLLTEELVPSPFSDRAELNATADAAVRTGFLSTVNAMGGTLPQPSRWFLRLCELAPFEAALRAEPA